MKLFTLVKELIQSKRSQPGFQHDLQAVDAIATYIVVSAGIYPTNSAWGMSYCKALRNIKTSELDHEVLGFIAVANLSMSRFEDYKPLGMLSDGVRTDVLNRLREAVELLVEEISSRMPDVVLEAVRS